MFASISPTSSRAARPRSAASTTSDARPSERAGATSGCVTSGVGESRCGSAGLRAREEARAGAAMMPDDDADQHDHDERDEARATDEMLEPRQVVAEDIAQGAEENRPRDRPERIPEHKCTEAHVRHAGEQSCEHAQNRDEASE